MTMPSPRRIEAQRLAAIRARHAGASTDWRRGMTPAGEGLLARLIPEQEPIPVFIFDPWTDKADIEFGLNAHDDIAFLLALIDRAIAAHRKANPPPEPAHKPYSPAQNCGAWCGKPVFQKFMHEVHGLDNPSDPQKMRTKLHGLLAVRSRADLDTDAAAAERWHALRKDFKTWRDQRL